MCGLFKALQEGQRTSPGRIALIARRLFPERALECFFFGTGAMDGYLVV